MDSSVASSPLLQYARNVTSQFGEDGIIEEIFRRIGVQNRACIEFGAWDGEHLSNTYHLWHSQNWHALLIEGDSDRCNELRKKTAENAFVTVVNAYVMPEGKNSLDSLVEKEGFEANPDLLSIDIDGDDYYIVCSLKTCRPRVLLVEYNPTIPPHIDLSQAFGGALGSSALAIVRAASSKDYKLACMTDSNCIFVRSEEFHKLTMPELDVAHLFPTKYLSYVFADYLGNCYLTSKPVYTPNLPTFGLRELLDQWRRWRQTQARPTNYPLTDRDINSVQLFSTKIK